MIADDHPVVREGLVEVFKSQTDIKVVAEATNGEGTLEMCKQHLPDVLLLDLRMPRKDRLQVMTELAGRSVSGPAVIVMTTYDSEDDIHRSLKTGAKGYLVKDIAPEQIRNQFAEWPQANPFSCRTSRQNSQNLSRVRSSRTANGRC